MRLSCARARVERHKVGPDGSVGTFLLCLEVEHRGEDLDIFISELRNLAIFSMLEIGANMDPQTHDEVVTQSAEAAIRELWPDRAYYIETPKMITIGGNR